MGVKACRYCRNTSLIQDPWDPEYFLCPGCRGLWVINDYLPNTIVRAPRGVDS